MDPHQRAGKGGKAADYVDGVLKTTIKLYAAAVRDRVGVHATPVLSRGAHTLKGKLTLANRVNVDQFQHTP